MMNIDTEEVLRAAGTKWNFLPFQPGLVGGHCIGVDPYYLTYKCENMGYRPNVILAGRKINDEMGFYVADKLISKMKKKLIPIKNSRVLIMGVSFKENCPDIRNTGVRNVIENLKKNNLKIDLYDPVADRLDIKKEFKIDPIKKINSNIYDAIVLSVAHDEFKKLTINKLASFCKKNHIIYDLKYIFNKELTDLRL